MDFRVKGVHLFLECSNLQFIIGFVFDHVVTLETSNLSIIKRLYHDSHERYITIVIHIHRC